MAATDQPGQEHPTYGPADPTCPDLEGTLTPHSTVGDQPDLGPLEFPNRRYVVTGQIARGGMGVVLRVIDTDLQRPLAVKVLLDRKGGKRDYEGRFLEEARITGQLQHPGIAPVHEIGHLADGRPFFSMKLIEGQTLAELLNQRSGPQDDLARFLNIFEQVVQTLAYAHSHGVIHRDLKPANVMVGEFGEVQVMDWGLAKRLREGNHAEGPSVTSAADVPTSSGPDDAAFEDAISQEATLDVSLIKSDASQEGASRTYADSLTQAGQVMGTLAYMPPEQARGEVDRLDERSDVFGLGAILCEMLTGVPPYRTAAGHTLLQQAQRGDLTDAWQRLDGCGADLELVALAKVCLADAPRDRPPNAGVVAEQIGTYLSSLQRRLKQAEIEQAAAQTRAAEELKRRRVSLALAASLVVLITGAAGVGMWYQRDRANLAEERSEIQSRQTQRLARAERNIAVAVQEAETLSQRASALVDSPHQWQATLAAALSAIKRAEALVAEEPAAFELALRKRMDRLAAQLRAEENDRQFLAKFDAVRQEQAEVDVEESRFKTSGAFPKLKQAFADHFQITFGGTAAQQAAARIHERPEAVQHHLLAALDVCWYYAPLLAPQHRQWLAEVLQQADRDPWRNRVREALESQDWQLVQQTLAEAPISQQPPAFLLLVAQQLPRQLAAAQLELLQRTQQAHAGDFWANHELGWAYQKADPPQPAKVGRYYAAAVALRPDNAGALLNYGNALREVGEVDAAVAVYQRALAVAPDYAAAHNSLGLAWSVKREHGQAIAAYRRALAIHPDDDKVYVNLGITLMDIGNIQGALTCYLRALAINPRNYKLHNNLGIALRNQGDLDGAIAAYRDALKANPRYAPGRQNLGLALKQKGNLEGAMAEFRRAIELDPRYASPYYQLALCLKAKGDRMGAMKMLRQALAMNPRSAQAHYNLGLFLREERDLEGAIVELNTAVELAPQNTTLRVGLASALSAHKDHDAAIAQLQAVIAQDPKHPTAFYQLGYAFHAKGELDGAATAYQQAIALAPNYAEAYCGLGSALTGQGKFADAVEAYRRGHELGIRNENWSYPSERWFKEAQRRLELNERLASIQQGKTRPQDAAEKLELAQFALQFKQHYLFAARWYEELFSDAKSAAAPSRHGFDAARAAAAAAAGKGPDAMRLSETERTRWRNQALAWLQGELQGLRDRVQLRPENAAAVSARLQSFLTSPDLASVREQATLEQLPPKEQAAWRKLWDEVVALRAAAESAK